MKEGREASYQSKEEFFRNFGDHPDAVWSATNAFDKVVFDNNGIITTAYYDFDAKLVGTTNVNNLRKFTRSRTKRDIERLQRLYC